MVSKKLNKEFDIKIKSLKKLRAKLPFLDKRVIIKKGKKSQIVATVMFDKFGKPTVNKVFIVKTKGIISMIKRKGSLPTMAATTGKKETLKTFEIFEKGNFK